MIAVPPRSIQFSHTLVVEGVHLTSLGELYIDPFMRPWPRCSGPTAHLSAEKQPQTNSFGHILQLGTDLQFSRVTLILHMVPLGYWSSKILYIDYTLYKPSEANESNLLSSPHTMFDQLSMVQLVYLSAMKSLAFLFFAQSSQTVSLRISLQSFCTDDHMMSNFLKQKFKSIISRIVSFSDWIRSSLFVSYRELRQFFAYSFVQFCFWMERALMSD